MLNHRYPIQLIVGNTWNVVYIQFIKDFLKDFMRGDFWVFYIGVSIFGAFIIVLLNGTAMADENS